MKKILSFMFFTVFMAAMTESASAHGVGYSLSELPAISLEFTYSDGAPIAYAEAKVYSPTDGKIAFQSGRTDEKGRFAFTPDSEGDWKVVVADDEGHKVQAPVPYRVSGGEDSAPSPMVPLSSRPAGKFVGSVAGVSVLFNIAAATLLYRKRA